VPDYNFPIFSGVPADAAANTLRALPARNFAPGETLLREDQPNGRVFLVEEGELEVWKGDPKQPQGVCVARLKSGECFGEMSAINSAPSSATVVAGSPVRVRVMALEDLPQQGNIKEQVTLNLARILVRRLSSANGEIQTKHQSELKAMQRVTAASAFVSRMLTVLSLYMFSLPFVAMLIPLLPTETLVSFFFIVVFVWVVVNFMQAQPQVRVDSWFMTFKDWPRQLWRALPWTVPPILVFVAIKLSVMHTRPDVRFFDPMSAIGPNLPMDFPMWAGFAAGYTALCFAQEFIRCAVQGTIALINGAASGPWKPILLADVVFMSVHLHLGPAFAAQAFLGGLFFGYEFHKERSYLSVAITHSLVGLFAVFIAGIPR